jgi:hypothetical protein
MYTGVAQVFRFCDDKPNMRIMSDDDYYWRNWVTMGGKNPEVEVCVLKNIYCIAIDAIMHI